MKTFLGLPLGKVRAHIQHLFSKSTPLMVFQHSGVSQRSDLLLLKDVMFQYLLVVEYVTVQLIFFLRNI